ncbi:MAG: ATP-binding cassette domain-containing protein [Treponema sp.]|nr:ATP-binding cassette domain-containing protein [Treponema sp.]
MIEVSHVSRTFGTFRAVNDVSFSIPTGQIVGLLGPNGAGKTTTMRMITGFLKPTDGSVKIDGIDITEQPVESKRKIGYMPESAPLYGDMIVCDYLNYIADIEGKNAAEKVPLLCKECGLEEVMHKNISDLSRGYRQRVGLAHALMNDPEILILDEPTSGLDPNQIEEVRALIKEIGKTRTVIISTHILSEVEMLCSRVIIISGGKLVADSPTDQLRTRFGNSAVIKVTTSATESQISEILHGIQGIESLSFEKTENGSTALLSVKGTTEIRPAIAKAVLSAGYDLFELVLQRNSLEDVFHILTTENSAENGVKDEK